MKNLYRKKPVVIEAFIFGVDYMPDWFLDSISKNDVILRGTHKFEGGIRPDKNLKCEIKTKEGVMTANYGDYIIKEPYDKERAFYPCKPDIFDMTYEKINNV